MSDEDYDFDHDTEPQFLCPTCKEYVTEISAVYGVCWCCVGDLDGWSEQEQE